MNTASTAATRGRLATVLALAAALLAACIAFAPISSAAVSATDDECYVEREVTLYRWYRAYQGPKEVLGVKYVDGSWVSDPGNWNPVPAHLNPPNNLVVGQTGSFTGSNKPYGLPNSPTTIQWRYQGGEEWWPSQHGWAPNLDGAGDGAWGNAVASTTVTEQGDSFPCPEAEATPGDCEAPGTITVSESEHYTSEIDGHTVTFTATPPAVFGEDVQTVFEFPEIAQLEGEECEEPPTTTTSQPGGGGTTTTSQPGGGATTTSTTEDTTTTTDDALVGGIGAEDDGGVSSGGATLPRTGGGGVTAMVGMFLLGLGAVFRSAGRRVI